jgi:hypothetical protein
MNTTTTYTANNDTSFPYVLVSSTLGALFSLATVWIATAAFGPVAGV